MDWGFDTFVRGGGVGQKFEEAQLQTGAAALLIKFSFIKFWRARIRRAGKIVVAIYFKQ
jgi:hypothetical protein